MLFAQKDRARNRSYLLALGDIRIGDQAPGQRGTGQSAYETAGCGAAFLFGDFRLGFL